VQSAAPHPPVAAPRRYVLAIERGREILQEMLGRGIPGLSVAVAVDGEIVWAEGFGYADLENRVRVSPSTKFRIGSISKPLTAAALAQLYEEGRLDLDAPIQRYLPTFPDKRYPITARQLAGHLAGIRHYRSDEFFSAKHYNSVLEGLEIFKDDPLLYPPGTKFSYSSYGWNLLSAVIEAASRKDFLSYMGERVFRPLGMQGTVADHTTRIIEQRARFYQRNGAGRFVNAPYVDNSYKWAGGGFLSTAVDLARFGSAHVRPGFLKQETLNLLFTSQRTASGTETGYGLGWFVEKDARGRRRIRHGGGSVGGTAMLILYPDYRIVVAVLANLTNAPLNAEDFQKLADLFLE
jgi:CubicO group peptidase (beta-lactamase class C family)